MLSRPKDAPLASWITGWFNLLGQVAVTTGIRYSILPACVMSETDNLHPDFSSFACANFISTAATFGTDFAPNEKTTIGIYAGVLITQGEFAATHDGSTMLMRDITEQA